KPRMSMPSQAGSATKICSRFHNVRSTTLAKSPRCRLPDSLVMPNAIADCKGHSLRVRCRQVAHKNSFDARRFKCVFITRDCVTGAATMQARSVIGVVLNSCGRRSSQWLDSTGAQRRHYVRIKTSPDVLVLAISPNGTPDLVDGFATTRDGSLGKGRNRSEGNGFDHANDFADVPCLGSAEPGAQSHHAAIDGVRRYR